MVDCNIFSLDSRLDTNIFSIDGRILISSSFLVFLLPTILPILGSICSLHASYSNIRNFSIFSLSYLGDTFSFSSLIALIYDHIVFCVARDVIHEIG